MGCCQTLHLLVDNFPVTLYPKAWSFVHLSMPVALNTPADFCTSANGSSPKALASSSLVAESSRSGPLSLFKLQLKKAAPVVSSTEVSAKTGIASYKQGADEGKVLFVRAVSPPQSSRGVEGLSSLLSQVFTKNKRLSCKDQKPLSGGPLVVVMSLLKSSLSLDLQVHQDIMLLCAKLLHMCGVHALLAGGPKSLATAEESNLVWSGLRDKQLVPCMVQLFTHLFRLLNVLCHVMEDKEPCSAEVKVSCLLQV